MAKRIKGITIELDGETRGLDKALKDVNKRSRDLQGELRDVDKLLKFNPGNTELLAQQQKLLGDQVENTADKLKQLRNAQKQVEAQFKSGAIDESQYRAFRREITETESKLEHFQNRLKTSQKATRDFGQSMRDAGNRMKDVGGNLSARFTAPILAGLGLVTKGTEEFREDLARLEQNANSAGISASKMEDALTKLSGVTGEADSNVEALSNLLATGFDEQGLTAAVDALSGAVIKFPDTLNIEGLADGLQETVATGKAVGPFAELLERLGVDLETFDKGLQNAAESGQAQNFVLQELANTGLSQVNEQYRKNNEELVNSRESASEFQQSMAELGETLAPIVTNVTNLITDLVNKFNELSPTMQNVIIIVTGLVAVLGPLITIAGMLTIAIGAISLPVLAVIAGITALIAIGVLLWKNWDTVKKYAQVIWASIATIFKTVWNSIKTVTLTVWNSIKSFISTTWNVLKAIGSTVFNVIKSTISGVWNGIKSVTSSVWNGIKSTITGIWDGLKSGVKRAFNFIRDTISGVWDKIKSITDDVWGGITDSIKGAINTVIDTINGMIDAINGISIKVPKVPDWVPGPLGGKGGGTISFPNIPKIPKLDVGTNYVAKDGLAYLHEGEAVVPKKYNPAVGGNEEMISLLQDIADNIKQGNVIQLNVDGEVLTTVVNTRNAVDNKINYMG